MSDAPRFSPFAWLRGVLSSDCTLDPQEALVMLEIVRRCDADGQAFPGYGTISGDTRVSRSKVIETIPELEARGLLTVERQTRGAGKGSNRYTLPPEPAPSALGGLPRTTPRTRRGSAPGGLGSAPGGLGVVRLADGGSAPGGPYLPSDLPTVSAHVTDPTSPSSVGSGTFELTSQSSDQKPSKNGKRQARPKGQGEPEATGGEHQPTVDHYFEAFKAKHGRPPIFGKPEGKAVKTLLEKLKGDGAEARRRIDNAFASFRAASVTILDIAGNTDAFASAEPAKKTNGQVQRARGPVQHHGVDVFAGAKVITS